MDDGVALAKQEAILSQFTSGYGREQVVRAALRMACESLISQARQLERDMDETADEVALDYLVMAQTELGEENWAEEEPGA